MTNLYCAVKRFRKMVRRFFTAVGVFVAVILAANFVYFMFDILLFEGGRYYYYGSTAWTFWLLLVIAAAVVVYSVALFLLQQSWRNKDRLQRYYC